MVLWEADNLEADRVLQQIAADLVRTGWQRWAADMLCPAHVDAPEGVPELAADPLGPEPVVLAECVVPRGSID